MTRAMDQAASRAGLGGDCDQQSGRPHATPDAAALARDWITLWESELAAMAADREVREAWQTTGSLWAAAMVSILRTIPRGREQHRTRDDEPDRRTGSADASRATPAAVAPDPRDAEIDRLSCQVAALERRLAGLERQSRRVVDPKGRPRRKS